MRRQHLQIDSRTIAYFDTAPSERDAPVLLLLHAFPLAAAMWTPQLEAAPARWRMIAPDLRGFGASTADEIAGHAPLMDDYAADLIALVRTLEIDAPVIGGLSMGGYATLALLRREPRLARGLVLADTRVGADSPEGRHNRQKMLALLDRAGPSAVADDLLPKALGATTRAERPDIVASVRQLMIVQPSSAIRAAIVRMMDRPDSSDVLAGAGVPTLILVGEEDTLTPPAEAERMAALVPGAALVRIPRAGHLANLEQPEAFSSALGQFLARL